MVGTTGAIMAARQVSPRPGKSTPRLVQDLLDYDPRHANKKGKNILTEPAPHYHGIGLLRTGTNDCRHKLIKKPSQTDAPLSNDERPTPITEYTVATYCESCHYHFTIRTDYRQRRDGQVPCHLGDQENPLHHLRLESSLDEEECKAKYGASKYQNMIEAHTFICTGTHDCPLIVEIQIRPPRILPKMSALITDVSRVWIRGQTALQRNPSRLMNLEPLQPIDALGFLRQYLIDGRSATPKKIARRNKKYMLAFADDCDAMFEYLDFVLIEEEEEEVDEAEEGTTGFWQLPTVTDENRDFIDDVIIENQLLIAKRPRKEHEGPRGPRPVHIPLSAMKDIERSLGYFEYPKRSRVIDTTRDEHPYYASLGATDDLTNDHMEWAYDRQCKCDPLNKPYYLDCIANIAEGRGDGAVDLQTKVAMAISSGEVGLNKIEEAYKFFGLAYNTKEGDEHVMGLYKSRIESAPRQKDEARDCLHVIAKHRNSEKIEALANDKALSFDEALEFLHITANTDSDSIEAAAIALSFDQDKAKVARALRAISNRRPGDFTILRAAATMESGDGSYALSIGDAYKRLQIQSETVMDETVYAYYANLTQGAAPGQLENYNEALRTIALDRNSNFLLRKLDDPDAEVEASTSEPVGIDNIGNTCYLNSLLQYYYTIKPVRDMVIDYQNHRTDLSVESLQKKRVGGRIVDRREVMKAIKFVEELHNLFEKLKTASTSSVKPTRELAKLTIFSSEREENARRMSVSSPQHFQSISSVMESRPVYGPQWPPPAAKPTLSPISAAEEDVEMIDHPVDKENDDASSEATLVDGDALPSYKEANNSNAVPNMKADDKASLNQDMSSITTAELEGDTVMINSDNLANGTDKTIPAPENPPPVPPRKNVNLSIETKAKDLDDDASFWREGTQQDVTEVIGNVNFRLQCAIKPTSIEEGSGEQIDIIRDTFFGTNTVYTQKARSLERSVEAWPMIIVFPGDSGPRDIYEALDVVYDEQIVEIDQTTVPQYSSISKLPPVLQIQIQRTDFDAVSLLQSKNSTQVIFPETIYLDRYLNTKDPNSELMHRRRETWKWKSELRTLNARYEALNKTSVKLNVPEALLATKDFISGLQDGGVDIDIPESLPSALEERITEVAAEQQAIKSRIDSLKQHISEQFENMKEHEYKLHAVFIHRGFIGSGHYWIYIFDFEHGVWREHNDETVSIINDPKKRVFGYDGPGDGTPYYLVYVRTEQQKDLIDAVCRDVQEDRVVEMVDNDVEGSEWPEFDQDVTGNEMEGVRHIEHAAPRPLRPKPTSNGDSVPTWDNEMAASTTVRSNSWDAPKDPW